VETNSLFFEVSFLIPDVALVLLKLDPDSLCPSCLTIFCHCVPLSHLPPFPPHMITFLKTAQSPFFSVFFHFPVHHNQTELTDPC